MDEQRAKEGLIEDIYASALAPEYWTETMTRCADEFAADGVQALAYSNDGSSVRYCISGRVDPAADGDYIAHYHSTDIRIPRALAAPSFFVYDDHAFISATERKRSPFHNEFLKRYDCERILLASAPLTSTHMLLLASARSARRNRFSTEHRQRMLRYLPHLQRSMRMCLHALSQEERRQGIEALFNVHDLGIILLGKEHQIAYLNDAAQTALERSELVSARNGSFVIHGADNSQRFLHCVHRVQANFIRRGRRELEAIRLYGISSDAILDVLVLPLLLSSGTVLTAVYVADPAMGRGRSVELLMGLYQLTVAEGRCAELLVEGASIQEIAHRLNLARNTVRAQLRSIFAKTGTGRQGELIALFARNVAAIARMFRE